MDIKDALERAYKNGYEDGKNAISVNLKVKVKLTEPGIVKYLKTYDHFPAIDISGFTHFTLQELRDLYKDSKNNNECPFENNSIYLDGGLEENA